MLVLPSHEIVRRRLLLNAFRCCHPLRRQGLAHARICSSSYLQFKYLRGLPLLLEVHDHVAALPSVREIEMSLRVHHRGERRRQDRILREGQTRLQ